MSIKTIFFDFGGVLVNLPNAKMINRWKHFLGLNDQPEILAMLNQPNNSPLVRDICLGKISENEVWTMMAEQWQVKPAVIKQFQRRLISKRHLNRRMIKFMAVLQKKYQTAILSNAGSQTRRVIEDVFHLDQYVEEIIISAEEGVIKPDPQIYQIALDRMHASAGEALLLDDTLDNVESARAFGMKAVHFINNQQAVKEIHEYLNREV